MKRLTIIMMLICAFAALQAVAQRKITPITTSATTTQPINELENDTARINAKMRASMVHYHDDNGNIIYIDTITGREWRDSTAIVEAKKVMKYPLMHSASVGVDIWNPVMRAFGQKFGLIDFMASVSFHNRYKPVFETGLGQAHDTPADNNFTYKSPLSWYFKLGMDYNFLYNSSDAYQLLGGIRFGLSPFAYSLDNITIPSSYWDVTAQTTIPSQHVTVSWFELAIGLRVKIWGPISAGWTLRYHKVMHQSKTPYGDPWYIPGYGSRNNAINGSFTILYTLPISKKAPEIIEEPIRDSYLYSPETTGEPTPAEIEEGHDAQTPL